MKTPKQWRAAIRAGMAFLDAMRPQWRRRIDLEKLDLSEPDCCVLGEVYGDYFKGRDRLLNGSVPTDEYGDDELLDDDTRSRVLNARAQALGFYADRDEDYPRLTRLWREEYRKGQARRRANA